MCWRGLELIALQLELMKAAPEETIPLVHRSREIARRLNSGWKAATAITSIGSKGAAVGLSPSHSHRRLVHVGRKTLRLCRFRNSHLGNPGRGRRIRIHQRPPGFPRRPHPGRPQPFRLRRSRLCFTCPRIFPIRAAPPSPPPPPTKSWRILMPQPGPSLRPLHQLPADAPDL